MTEHFEKLAEELKSGPVVMATVVAIRGSTPRLAGARQFFSGNGESWGTVGGGIMEREVSELALTTLADGEPRTFEADLRGTMQDIRQGVCGGTMVVWIARLTAKNSGDAVTSLVERLKRGERAALSITLDPENPLCEKPGKSFDEILEPAPCALVCGAGHIGRALAGLLVRLGMQVVVQDERPEWLLKAAFPTDCRLEADLDSAVSQLLAWNGLRFVALVTRGFPQDVSALAKLSAQPDIEYVGMLGSRKRIETVLAAHRDSGAPSFPPEILHAPIGIELGAETPEEIAVSIAAEIISIRRKGERT